MNKRVAVFIIVLMVLLVAYMYSANKMIIYNHSGQTIDNIIVDAEFSHKELKNVQEGDVLKFTFFSPLDKKVKIQTKQPNNIRNTTFTLQGFFLGEKYNQVEITADGEIKSGALGIER